MASSNKVISHAELLLLCVAFVEIMQKNCKKMQEQVLNECITNFLSHHIVCMFSVNNNQ